MCAIFGVFNLAWSNVPEKQKALDLLMDLAKNSCERGRDAFGFSVFYHDLNDHAVDFHVRRNFRDIRSSSTDVEARSMAVYHEVRREMDDLHARLPAYVRNFTLIANCRAEPTTEWLKEPSVDDVQPYTNWPINRYYAVHNGVIANDHEYIPEESLTKVDSAAIAYAFAQDKVQNLIGSVATAVYDAKANHLLLARNYRPLSVIQIPQGIEAGESFGLAFASDEAVLHDAARHIAYQVEPLPANSSTYFRPLYCDDGEFLGRYRNKMRFDKNEVGGDHTSAIVVLSGGMDSTVSAKIACMHHQNVVLAHFHYGCRAQTRETEAVTAIHEALVKAHPTQNITLKFFDLDFLKQLGGNPLVDETMEVASGKDGIEYANEWVPFRNGLMVSMMAAYADRWNIGAIYTGANLEEAGAFGDNEREFFTTMEKAIAIGSKAAPKLLNPLDKMMKHEVAVIGTNLKAPIELSWSCYHGGELHCGNCGPCQLRRTAFAMNGLVDPVKYSQDAPLVGL